MSWGGARIRFVRLKIRNKNNMKKKTKCKKCGKDNILILGSDTYYCGNKKCLYFELFPKGIKCLTK